MLEKLKRETVNKHQMNAAQNLELSKEDFLQSCPF